MAQAKKESKKMVSRKAQKDAEKPKRLPVIPTGETLKLVREKCQRVDFPLACIKKTLNCTWKEAVALRHAALKEK